MRRRLPAAVVLVLCLFGSAARAGVDAPQLAPPGRFVIGLASLTLTQPAQPDVLTSCPKTGGLLRRDRVLPIDIWYPADPARGAAPVVYSGAFTGEDGKDVAFTAPGAAVRGAMSAAGSFPLVILAHGYGGTPVAMSWLAENLASKGYVVVGPHFNDPPITDAAGFAQPLARRPLDIAFVAAEVQARARLRQGVLAASDPARTVLVGYSMGGYGVLTDAGASLDPSLVTLTCGALATYVRGGRDAGSLKVANVRAVIAISPAGRFAGGEAWGAGGLGAITAPTLFIVGSRDRLIGYDPGVKTLFDEEVHAPRYLLTFRNAGHSIGMNAAPQAMRGRLWDLDWFEDPVWRKDRVLAIETHFITAFLDRYVKGDLAKAAYLDVTEPVSDRGVWPQAPDDRYDAYSPGKAPITLWKGFQRDHATGLELRFNPAQP